MYEKCFNKIYEKKNWDSTLLIYIWYTPEIYLYEVIESFLFKYNELI